MQLIGTPSEAELGLLNENAKRYIRQLPPYRRQSFTEKFPQVHPLAIDLVEKMLTFDPRQRITGTTLLASFNKISGKYTSKKVEIYDFFLPRVNNISLSNGSCSMFDFSYLFLSSVNTSVEGALAHPYLNSLHDISDEPICTTPFNFDFEQHALTEDQMKELIYREALAFNPEYQPM